MNIILVVTLLSAVCSIVSVFIPERWKSKKIFWALFIFVMCILCSVITLQQTKINQINKVSKAAKELSSNTHGYYSNSGYIQACLAFLEQNQDLYPDAYSRAKELYSSNKEKSLYNDFDYRELAIEIEGLIKGIAVLNKEK
jgi:hypothetical protein